MPMIKLMDSMCASAKSPFNFRSVFISIFIFGRIHNIFGHLNLSQALNPAYDYFDVNLKLNMPLTNFN